MHRLPPLVAILIFIALATPFLNLTGLHVDASYEIGCGYQCFEGIYVPKILGHSIPVMVIPYLGALKAWLYQPLLQFPVTTLSMRLPLLLIGSCTILFFFLIAKRAAGLVAATAAALLLASDPSFVLVTAYDFGPVAMLHCLMLGGILSLLNRRIGLAFALFGLALWHKAVFVWMLGGLTAAALVYCREWKSHLRPKLMGLAVASFCLGALPLIFYNIAKPAETLRLTNVAAGATPIGQKLEMLRYTLDGTGFWGFITNDASPAAGTGLPYVVLAAIAFLPFLRNSAMARPMLSALAYLLVTWGLMAAVPGGGTAVHHSILVYPAPHLFVALAAVQMAQKAGRMATAAGVLLLLALLLPNLLLLSRFHTSLRRNGTPPIWTEAVNTLSQELTKHRDRRIVPTDWGYAQTLCLLANGNIDMYDISSYVGEKNVADIRSAVLDKDSLFVGHAAGSEQFAGVNAMVDEIANQADRVKARLTTIRDRKAHPRFEIFRYVPRTGPSTISMADAAAGVWLRGFHDIDDGKMRWTKGSFEVLLYEPPTTGSFLNVEMELYLPPLILERFGKVTLTADADGAQTAATFTTSGAHQFRGRVPRTGAPHVITFSLNKFMTAGTAEKRELGVVVTAVTLR